MPDTTSYGPTPSVGLDDFQAITNMDYHTMPWTNGTGSNVANGAPVVVNGVVGVAIGPIDNGKSGTLLILTVVDIVKKQETITQGYAVYWDPTGNPYGGTAGTGAATATATGAYFIGRAIATAGSTAARVRSLLIPNANGMTAFTAVTLGNVISGGIEQGTREQSATQNYPLGTKRVYSDGRTFRYVKARTALHTEFGACYAAKTVTCDVAPAQATGAGAVADVKVTMTVASGDGLAANGLIALNELAGGYVVIGNGGSQHPQNRLITANTAVAGGGGVCTLTLDEALDTVVTVGVTTIETLMNPWILSDGNVTSSGYVTFRGMPALELTINYFGWIQTAGPCWITSDTHTCDSAGDRQIYFAANGSVVSGNDVTGDINVQQLAGHAIDMSGSAASNAPFVNLCLETT